MLHLADALATWIPGVASNALLVVAVTIIWNTWKKRIGILENQSTEFVKNLPEFITLVKTISKRVDIIERQTSDLSIAVHQLNVDGQKFVTVERNAMTVKDLHEKINAADRSIAKLETAISYLEKEIQKRGN